MSFWNELRRRNVFKVGVAYAIVAWLLIQGADIVSPHLRLPEWTVPLVIILLSIGFPIALILAWAFELTPDGIKLTKEVPHAESITHLTGQKFNYIVTGLLVLAVGFLAVKVFFLDKGVKKIDVVSTETGQVPAVSDVEKTKKTIAVLPFENLSSDPEQMYFVDGLSEEILNSLAQISDLNVIGRTSSFSFKGSNKKVQEIANELGADNILEGSVRKAGNALRITAQLLRGTDGVHLWSKTYDRELKDIFAVQEDIATAVADELKATLGIGKSLRPLGGTDNTEAYELFLIARAQSFGATYVAISRALDSVNSAIALDPEFAQAWLLKATIHSILSNLVPFNRLSEQIDAGTLALQKAIELGPNSIAAYNAQGMLKLMEGEWIDAELAFQKAIGPTIDQSLEYQESWVIHYFSVFNFKKANELIEANLLKDPLNQIVRGFYVGSFIFSGDMKRAKEEYERATVLFGDQWLFNYISIILARRGAHELTPLELVTIMSHIYNPIPEEKRSNLKSAESVLAELRRLYAEDNNLSLGNLIYIAEWTAYFGDPMIAMAAMEKAVNIIPYYIYDFWNPVFKEVRQLPRFKELVREIGLVDYWNKFGWPDLCRPVGDGDFECD